FVQGPTRSGGGLWIVNKLTIVEENFTDESMREALQINSRDSLHRDAPAVGDASIAFRRGPFDRYIFAKGNLMIDLYCNSIFTGYHSYCSVTNMAEMAQNIYARLPETIEPPQAIVLPPVFDGGHQGESPLHDLQLGINEGMENSVELYGYDPVSASVSDQNYLGAAWFLGDWVSSLEVGLYWQEGQRYIYAWEGTSIQSVGIGPGRMNISPGEAGDIPILPTGSYTLRAFVEDRFVDEIEFFLIEEDN
ncbi:MAG: hypothetical protein HN413_13880, partial [Chloroflexi bacterium]|nr:hypothetical protein [Chloroflexota bacterium]